MHGYWIDFGLVDYESSFAIQEKALKARINLRLPPIVIIQENPRTFTIGKSGSRSNILATADELNQQGIQVIEVNRGGDVTYHGPGQMIASPLLYLGDLKISANQYMHGLEKALLLTLADFGILASQRPDQPGAWVNDSKIGSVGIAVRHGYTFHGISLNVNLDTGPYQMINPCGYINLPVTSMHLELGRTIPINQVHQSFRKALEQLFDLQLADLSIDCLNSSLA